MQNEKLILSGLHLELTDALKNIVHAKTEKLFRHSASIIRARVELECLSHLHNAAEFVAKGHLDLEGPDIFVSVSTDDLYKSIDQLIDKLDRKLSRRARLQKTKRRDTRRLLSQMAGV
jgi:putative sigma-54 modulation protein